MIKYKQLWLYGFWQGKESEDEFIVYGVNKKVLLIGVFIQTLITALYLYAVLKFSFEGTTFFLIGLFIMLILFIYVMQRNIFWLKYNANTKSLMQLSKGFKSPNEIRGNFTMTKKNFLEKSGYIEK